MNHTIEINTVDALLIVQLLHNNYLKNETDKLIAERLKNEIIEKVSRELSGKQFFGNQTEHGYWRFSNDSAIQHMYCSVCNTIANVTNPANQKMKPEFCPHCGAIMDM